MGYKTGLFVHTAIEARVCVGVLNNHALAGGKHIARHATGIKDAYLALEAAHSHARIKLFGVGIIEEKGSTLGPQLGSRHFDQHVKYRIKGINS